MKTVLVTGGVRGIGLAIAKKFKQSGARVCVTYTKDEESAAIARDLGLEVYRSDASKESDVVALFRAIGEIDVLVNNVGTCFFKQIQDVTYEEFQQVFAVNTGSAFLCSREAAKGMISNQRGHIVNISSVWGEVGGSCESVYSASKAALLGFTKALAKELGYSHVRVNAVSPGVIDTQMNARFSDAEKRELCEEIPLGRMGLADEVANAVFALDENEYITGVDLPINGGFSIV